MSGPLKGVRVIDWTQWQVGPVATAMLADLGAEIIKIEDRVSGDGGRYLLPGGTVGLPHGKNTYFEVNNRGKKSVTVDLEKEKGREIIYQLVQKADVFVHNYRQGVPEKLKLDYETISQHNPQIVYVAASGYGPKGPEAKEPVYDLIGQARSGLMMLAGEANSPPQSVQGGVADQITGIMTGYAVLAGLLARERLGIGQKIDTSMLGSVISLIGLTVGIQLLGGVEEAKKWGDMRHDRKKSNNALWNWYLCKDGRWLMMAMLQHKYWPLVCKALAVEFLENDPRFETPEKRAENCEELIHILDEIFITKPASEWMKVMKERADVVITPIQNTYELVDDPQVLANDYITDCHHEILGPVKVLGVPCQFSKTPAVIKPDSPELGQNTEEVLIEIGGYSWDDIQAFKDEEVI